MSPKPHHTTWELGKSTMGTPERYLFFVENLNVLWVLAIPRKLDGRSVIEIPISLSMMLTPINPHDSQQAR